MPQALRKTGGSLPLDPTQVLVAAVILLTILMYWLIGMALLAPRRRRVVLGRGPRQ